MTTNPSTTTSADRVRRIYDGYTGLYAPSVIEEAAALLDDLLEVAARHGHTDARSDASGWLVQAAAEATSTKYQRPPQGCTSKELLAIRTVLTDECTARGMTVVPCWGPGGVAVAPILPGPTWGHDTGLAVLMSTNSGWDLSVNQSRTRVFSIYAPVTEAGAAEVADLIHQVLTGQAPDPFRR